jgi:hypothetical protein
LLQEILKHIPHRLAYEALVVVDRSVVDTFFSFHLHQLKNSRSDNVQRELS